MVMPANGSSSLRSEWNEAFEETRRTNAALSDAFDAYVRREVGAEQTLKELLSELEAAGRRFKGATNGLVKGANRTLKK